MLGSSHKAQKQILSITFGNAIHCLPQNEAGQIFNFKRKLKFDYFSQTQQPL